MSVLNIESGRMTERRMRLLRHWTFFLASMPILLLGGTIAQAASSLCALTLLPEGSTLEYKYASAFVDSLNYAQEAGARSERASQAYDVAVGKADKHSDVVSASGEWMYEIKLANTDYTCAASLIEGFRNSNDEAIRTSAEGAYLVYTRVAKLNGELLREMQGLLDSKEQVATGELLDRITDIGVKKNQVLKLLLVASVSTNHALVLLPEKPDERLSRLRITQKEREDLLKEIERMFGPSVKQGMQAGQPILEAAAAAMHEFLSNRAWKALDDK